MQEVDLYQTVHILGGRSLHLPAHLAVLDRWSRELFGRPAGLRQQPLARQIEALAAQTAPADCDLSQFVRIVVPASGDPAFRLESAGISLYRGYDLRSLMPDAVTLQYDMPFPEAPTSAREAAAGLARQQARLHGASVAVRCDGDGIVRTADNAPLFAVRGKTAFVSPAEACVEQELGLRAVEAAGLELEERPVMRDELPRFDELFYVDHRGVTALAHCDGHPCMAILAERVAQSLGGLFPKMSKPNGPGPRYLRRKTRFTMKKYLFLYAVAVTALLVCGYGRYRRENRRLTQNQHALAAGIERYRTRLGQEAASVQALRLRCAEFEELRAADAAEIRRLGIKLRRLEAAARTATATKVEIRTPVRDTVVVRLSDTLVVRDTLRLFRWRDAWVRVEGAVTADSVLCRVESADTLRQVVHRIPRRFLFIRWGTKALRQEIVPSNPHTRIVYSEYVKIER